MIIYYILCHITIAIPLDGYPQGIVVQGLQPMQGCHGAARVFSFFMPALPSLGSMREDSCQLFYRDDSMVLMRSSRRPSDLFSPTSYSLKENDDDATSCTLVLNNTTVGRQAITASLITLRSSEKYNDGWPLPV